MSDAWLDVIVDGTKSRHPLLDGLTRVGGGTCDVLIEDVGDDELHVWSSPPKVLLAGGTSAPLLNGRVFDEAPLVNGDSIQWGKAVLVYGAPAILEELPPEPQTAPVPVRRPAGPVFPSKSPRPAPVLTPEPSPVPVAGPRAPGGVLEQRLVAGMLVDLGIADRKLTKRWQEAVMRKEFDADACARDLLAQTPVTADDPRILDRARTLQRDLLMMPIQRGAQGVGRRARKATRSGMAYLMANLIAISIYTLVIMAIMLLVRVNYDFSFDGTIDAFLGFFGGGE